MRLSEFISAKYRNHAIISTKQKREGENGSYEDITTQIGVKQEKAQRTEYMTASRVHLKAFEYGNEPPIRSESN